MYGKIEIAIVDSESSREETIIQIANCLDDLKAASLYIFQSIDDRLANYTKRLTSVRERTCRIQNQLQYLQNNMNLKAIKMYSASKYPANSTYQEYQTIIASSDDKTSGSETPKESSEVEMELGIKTRVGTSRKTSKNRNRYPSEVDLKEKLQFYYVKPLNENKSQEGSRTQTKSTYSSAERVSSVSALLINESTKPDYSQLQSSGPDSQRIQDAPDSILQSWHSSEFDSPSYLYAPTLGEVPQINVPAILPDLPGIVDDERFVLDLSSQSPIAPSSALTSPIVKVDLPEGVSIADPHNKLSKELVQTPNLPNIADSVPDAGPQISPPPPPPPPPLETTQHKNPPTSLPLTAPIQPPPPPPPPPPTASTSSENKEQESEKKPSAPVQAAAGDDRTNLMAAIRAAGGVGRAKLKSTVDEVEKPSERWSSASVGGDLMADLHAKLSLRRKGIAGGGMGALERISRLIPPPPKPNEASDRNSATSENDSQPDADEWEE